VAKTANILAITGAKTRMGTLLCGSLFSLRKKGPLSAAQVSGGDNQEALGIGTSCANEMLSQHCCGSFAFAA
jgi:hypothetical protein